MTTNITRIITCGALVSVAVLSCIGTRAYYVSKHEAFISKLNATALEAKENQVLREQELSGVITDLLEESHGRQLEIERLSAERASLLSRLRDPGSTSGSRTDNKNKSSGNNHETVAGTELSREATEFLLLLTRDADQVMEQLRLCQNFVRHITKNVK